MEPVYINMDYYGYLNNMVADHELPTWSDKDLTKRKCFKTKEIFLPDYLGEVLKNLLFRD